ncbi:LuxR C-terminal-related transcriptional regulator [Uliginosibacterium sp. sgz301328]|uniref:LuxR C-terminal-related transcriptional regulator n=1 Tax=Uliginosibacterium sp. sgz301328 TaxID=3243764 RepID=UPI00359D3D0A
MSYLESTAASLTSAATHPSSLMAPRTTLTHAVMIVDPHPMIHVGVRGLLENDLSLTLVASVRRPDEALQTASRLMPDVIVTDPFIANNDDLQFVRDLVALPYHPNVLLFCDGHHMRYTPSLAKLGIKGFMYKESALNDLATTIRLAASGFTCLPHSHAARLTRREIEVVLALLDGRNNLDVAADMGLSPKTVSHHRVAALKKLSMPSLAALAGRHDVTQALRRGEYA